MGHMHISNARFVKDSLYSGVFLTRWAFYAEIIDKTHLTLPIFTISSTSFWHTGQGTWHPMVVQSHGLPLKWKLWKWRNLGFGFILLATFFKIYFVFLAIFHARYGMYAAYHSCERHWKNTSDSSIIFKTSSHLELKPKLIHFKILSTIFYFFFPFLVFILISFTDSE